jgi:hypothetical protein
VEEKRGTARGLVGESRASGVGGRGAPRAPVAFLREQASLLGENARRLVEGWVVVGGDVPQARLGGTAFVYGLLIVAPSLPRCKYRLLTVAYGRWFYPVDVFVAQEVLEELLASEPALDLAGRLERCPGIARQMIELLCSVEWRHLGPDVRGRARRATWTLLDVAMACTRLRWTVR